VERRQLCNLYERLEMACSGRRREVKGIPSTLFFGEIWGRLATKIFIHLSDAGP